MNIKFNEEVNLDQNLTIKALIIPHEMAISSEIKDGDQTKVQYNHKFELIKHFSETLVWQPFTHISNVIYIILKKRRFIISELSYKYSTDCKDTKISNLSKKSTLSIYSESPIYFPLKFYTTTAHSEKIKFHFKYLTEGKYKDVDAILNLKTVQPFILDTQSTSRIGSIGVLCNAMITNVMNISAYNVKISVKHEPFFISLDENDDNFEENNNLSINYSLDSSENFSKSEDNSEKFIDSNENLLKSEDSSEALLLNSNDSLKRSSGIFDTTLYKNVIHKIPTNNTYSKVFQYEFSPNMTFPKGNKNVGSLSVRFSISDIDINSYRDRRYEITFPNCFQIHFEATDDFPLTMEMIGSPQAFDVLKPFIVKVAVHNSSEEQEIEFALDAISNPEKYLVPYGQHLNKGKIGPGESTRFDMSFVGVKQGLLQYPPFWIEISDGRKKMLEQDGGVFIVKDASVLHE
ncbi:hypothetical protein TRFO_03217 [Tritrichomonas foetus]|uniref:Uncharacterized protein n=1 Tax=Tritrichomonas foetus TaxID=1144522 RepID=A0A1J4KS90_9EUKA|nr:hypothetical protein TRFO_03217 [Tritrichomonas foetus]|eukprot:OHT14161.1 hypothetical protein TRFO_03217 [Tritrichomonas foetus]